MTRGINVFVGKNAPENEVAIRGGWIELPQEPEDLRRFLIEVVGVDEEDLDRARAKPGNNNLYRIVDFERDSLAGELVEAGLRIGGETSLEEINLLAGVDDYALWDHDAVFMALREYPYELDPIICANYILQADEIDYQPYEDASTFCENDGPEYRFGYSCALAEGLLSALSDRHAEHYFDFERYGRSCAQARGVVLSEEGYLNPATLPRDASFDVEDIKELLGWREEECAQWVDESEPFEYLGCRPFSFRGETWIQLGDLTLENPDRVAEYASDHGGCAYYPDSMWNLASLRARAEQAMTPGHLQGDFFLNEATRTPYVATESGLVRVMPADLRACGYHDAPGELEHLVQVTNEALYFGGTRPVGNECLDSQAEQALRASAGDPQTTHEAYHARKR